jgi:cell division inhibitor SepF
MALKDSWHRTLVYFGLAEEYDDEDYDPDTGPEVALEDRYRERANVRRLSPRRRPDDIDDIFGEEQASGRQQTVLRSVQGGRGGNGGRDRDRDRDFQVHVVHPKSFNDAQQVADKFKRDIPVIINLQDADQDLPRRMIDFVSGLTYALDGGMQRIADKVFMLTPRNVELSAEERARLIEKGFFNQA